MAIDANGLNHFALTVSDLERSKHFYTQVMGFQSLLDVEGLALITGYGVLVGLHAAPPSSNGEVIFDPGRIGLDHLALTATVDSLAELSRELDAKGVPNNGVQQDELTKASYICMYDPDGIPWEFYAMPS